MIKSFAHGSLKRFFGNGKMKGVPQDIHELKGDRKGTWSIKVTGNYRLTFRFTAGEALDADLEDYH